MSSLSTEVKSPPRVLIVAPHQDDECIGCGGMLASHHASGSVVGVMYVAKSAAGKTIGDEALESCRHLGIVERYGLGTAPIGAVCTEDLLLRTVEVLRRFAPDIVYAPHPEEDDAHHRMVSSLAREALWLASYPLYPECGRLLPRPIAQLFWYEVWTPLARPTHIRDITPFVEKKRLAIQAYQSQVAITRFDEAILALNRYRGIFSGVSEYAEAFVLAHDYHYQSSSFEKGS